MLTAVRSANYDRAELSHIYFSTSSDSNTVYSIYTPWVIRYPSTIKNDLRSRGFYVHTSNPKGRYEIWSIETSVNSNSIYKGGIQCDSGTIENIPLLNAAESVLNDNYPAVEVALMMSGMIVAIVGVVAYCFFKKRNVRKDNTVLQNL